MSPLAMEQMPARGVRFALLAFGCKSREALIRAAHIKYEMRADGDESARRRAALASRIIAERLP